VVAGLDPLQLITDRTRLLLRFRAVDYVHERQQSFDVEAAECWHY
jgi:hypothetical protein